MASTLFQICAASTIPYSRGGTAAGHAVSPTLTMPKARKIRTIESQKLTVPNVIDRKLLRDRRNRHAHAMPDVRFLLDRVLADLCERLTFVKRQFETVLIIGAHAGVPVRCLQEVLPNARFIATDHAATLLGPSNQIRVLADEEALPFAPESFDLVIAPLTLHLVNDLPGVLQQIRQVLRPDGLFLGAVLGGSTLAELADAMLRAEGELCDQASMRVLPSIDVRQLGGLMQRAGFSLPVMDSDPVSVTYATPLNLMHEIKAMGTSNVLTARSKQPLSRRVLMRACEIYATNHATRDERITATFEILTMTGWAPHPNQQQPLKPGSATHRLADVLDTTETSLKDR